LKEAKDEADREVAAYKAEREAEFKQKMADNSTSSQEHIAQLNAESDRAVAAIKESINSKKEDVIQMMLKQVQNVTM
jgi:V-type H+-transporting ATPase subunit G